MTGQNPSAFGTVFVSWLLIWGSISPIVLGAAPPVRPAVCEAGSGYDSRCTLSSSGDASLLQVTSRMERTRAHDTLVDPEPVSLAAKGKRVTFSDLGQGSCQLAPTRGTPKVAKPLKHMHLGAEVKEGRCRQWCVEKSAPNSLGKHRCWGYTITGEGNCLIWKEGPLVAVSYPNDPARHCHAVLLQEDQPEGPPDMTEEEAIASGGNEIPGEGMNEIAPGPEVPGPEIAGDMNITESEGPEPSKKSCVICKLISQEVQQTVQSEVSTEVVNAKKVIEEEILKQLSTREQTVKIEIQKLIQKQMEADMDQDKEITKLADKVEDDLVSKGDVSTLVNRIETVEQRVSTAEESMSNVLNDIAGIKEKISDLQVKTQTFVTKSSESITKLKAHLESDTRERELLIMSQVVEMITNSTNHFNTQIMTKIEESITNEITSTIVKAERIVQDQIDEERKVDEEKTAEIKEKITKNWEKIETILSELRSTISQTAATQVSNAQEIKGVKDSLESVATSIVQTAVEEHAVETEEVIKALEQNLEKLEIVVEEESAAGMEQDKAIIELAEEMAKSEERVMKKAADKTKKDLEEIQKASADAAKDLEIQIGNIKSGDSGSSSEKSKLEKIVAELKNVQETVEAEKAERIKNTESVAILKKDAKVAKEMILVIQSDLESHKESSQKMMLEEVKVMVEESQLVTIQKTKEITVKEMSVEISKMKTSVVSKMEQSIKIIEEGQKAEAAEHEVRKKKLQDSLDGLSKKVDMNVKASEKISKDKDDLESSVKALKGMVEESNKEHEAADKEISSIKAYIEKIQKDLKENEESMPTKDELRIIEGALSKVKSKVVVVDEKIQTETKTREAALSDLEVQVTANEEHLDDLEEELMSIQEDIISVAGIMQELQDEQAAVADEAVKKALEQVQNMVTETTDKVMADEVELIRQETKEMMADVEKTVVTMQKKIESEKTARGKADEQIIKMQKTVEKLAKALDEKADAKTVDQVSKSLTTIQSAVVKEQVARQDSEKQMTMIKQAMSVLFSRTQRKEKEVKIVREVQQTHKVKKSYEKESTEKLLAAAEKVQKLEATTSKEIKAVQVDIQSVQSKIQAEAVERRKSDATLLVLKDKVKFVFKKLSHNSDKIEGLEAKINERLSALSQSLTELSVKVTVSGQSSSQDLTRMDTMLQTLVQDLQKEVAARNEGDTAHQTEMLLRIESRLKNVMTKEVSSTDISKVVTEHTSRTGDTTTHVKKTTTTSKKTSSSSSSSSSSKTTSSKSSSSPVEQSLVGEAENEVAQV
eukprot:gnl/MRDRNA2_/MRDRNA2_87912_c0_seq1.p1 gnl/MRDRNA2_/MRDRNA2_87912_c0~~gnl/MRDRNA2_/MRDRNA2_87912_c0_seq1.p1  ORF type:complete len:1284 (-),score=410.12 gnl/MRDRNA2_/MRDRNA2_87912_c0_seq1:84-3935(-)